MANPTVSIGLAVYNGERFLAEALDSFLAQSYTDFELIVSDNASTDRTGEIAREYAIQDPRIRYHCNARNVGLAGNFNQVFKMARGRYFKWAATDDLCRCNYLLRCVETLDNNPSIVLAYPRTQFIDTAGNSLEIEDPGWNLSSNEAHERLHYVIFAGHWANAVVGLIRTSALAKTRLMPPYPGGDYRVLGELSLLGQFYEIPETLFVRRLHPGSSSQHGTGGASPDARWLDRYWKGANSFRSMPRWRIHIDHFRTIIRSGQLSIRHKLSLTCSLLRHVRWQRRQLLQELLGVVFPIRF